MSMSLRTIIIRHQLATNKSWMGSYASLYNGNIH